jgi:DegV family protein with EDD domain
MGEYVILTDSCCDLNEELLAEFGVQYVPLNFTLEGQTYENWLDGRQLPFSEFYAKLRAGSMSTTAAVNPTDWVAKMEPILQDGKDILLIAFSSGLSSTYQAGVIAAEELNSRYPERTVMVVDSLCASSGEGLLVWYAAKKKADGASMQEVHDWLEENKLHLSHWFTVEDLNFLKRGGRVSATTALVGTVLGIKPVLHVDDEGHLINVDKTRGRKASLNALVDRMEKTAINPVGETVFISHGDCIADAEYVAEQVKSRLGVGEVKIFSVGPVIGSHSGPGTMALFFLGQHR